MKRMALSCAFMLLAAVPVWAQITVSGEGKVTATPDMATVVLAVVTEDPAAMSALDANSAAMGKLIKAMEALGVTKKELHTDLFDISPKYTYPKDSEPRLVGYVVSNQLTVQVCQTDTLGKILDSAVKSGATTVRSLTWGFKDPQKLLDAARVAAVKDAQRKATLLANTAGSNLGTIVSISESQAYQPRFGNMYSAARAPGADHAVPVEAGSQTLRVTVNAVWNVGSPLK